MNTVSFVIDDFFTCSKIPIKALDKDLNLICAKAYSTDLEKLYSCIDLHLNIVKFKNNITPINLELITNIGFTILPISRFNLDKGYYIFGPYIKTYPNTPEYEYLTYLSLSCVNYLTSLLINISDDKFSQGRINLNLNLYVKKAIEYTLKNYSLDLSVDSLCKELNINKSYFCKLFKESTGYTYSKYLNILRIEKSKKLLLNTNMSLVDISISVGFNSQNYYTMVFKKLVKMTPTQFRNKIIL